MLPHSMKCTRQKGNTKAGTMDIVPAKQASGIAGTAGVLAPGTVASKVIMGTRSLTNGNQDRALVPGLPSL